MKHHKSHTPIQHEAARRDAAVASSGIPSEAGPLREAAASGAPARTGTPGDDQGLHQELQSLRAEIASMRQQLNQLQAHEIKASAASASTGQHLQGMINGMMNMLSKMRATALITACHAHTLASIHSRVFPPLKDSLRGRHIALAAPGPSLLQAPKITDSLTAACNSSHAFFSKAGADYYFVSDYRARGDIEQALRTLPSDCRFFMGYSMGPIAYPEVVIPLHMQEDPRVSIFCDSACYTPRLELELYPVFQSRTIVHCMLHIALYMNPDVIYLLGCDTEQTGYFDGRDDQVQKRRMNVDELKYGYRQLGELQRHQRPRTRIVSVNPIGLRGFFEDVYTPQFLALHPEVSVPETQIVEHI